ncbi:MAG: hypothetical protein GY711_16055 [bacterium]|nr:hypothetical protein [bacterium]
MTRHGTRTVLLGLAALVLGARASAGTHVGANVLNADSGEFFTTIQEAIDDIDTLSGDTLIMQVATHAEGPQIFFDKDLTLIGDTGGTTLTTTADTGAAGDSRGWFLTELGTICAFSNLTFDGTGFRVWQGIRAKGDGTLTNCDFANIQYEASGPAYAGTGVVSIEAEWVLTNCTFANIGRIGFHVFGPGLAVNRVEETSFVGKGPGNWLDYAIEVGGGATVEVEAATITDCAGDASDGSASAGILVSTLFPPGISEAKVTLSTISDNTIGIAVGFDAADASSVLVKFNNIVDNDFGVTNTSQANEVKAEFNWWGDTTGPLDDSGAQEAGSPPCFVPNINPIFDLANHDGLGNFVSDNVFYCPWSIGPVGLAVGTSYCANAENSTGLPGRMVVTGDPSVSQPVGSFALNATDLPLAQFGYFLASDGAGIFSPATSNGNFCLALGPNLGRYDGDIQNSGITGTFSFGLDLSAIPVAVGLPHMLMAGETWYFQRWYRDSAAPSQGACCTNNFTDGIAVQFIP